MAKKKGSTAVATKKKDEVTIIGDVPALELIDQLAGAGNEEVTRETMALPFIGILQALSPQVSKRDDSYIEGAEPGMFFETVSRELWDGEEGIMVIPCHFQRVFVEWRKREFGGGFIAAHAPVRGQAPTHKLPEEHDLVDTHQHAVLVRKQDGTWVEAIWPMKSTALTPSRQWNTGIVSREVEIDGQRRMGSDLPRFYSIWKFTTAERENDKGRFYVPRPPERQVDLIELKSEEASALIMRAREFQLMCAAGKAAIDYNKLDENAVEDEEDDSDAPTY